MCPATRYFTLSILHSRTEKANPISLFPYLFKILPMQNLNLCKTHRFIEFLIKITYTYLYM